MPAHTSEQYVHETTCENAHPANILLIMSSANARACVAHMRDHTRKFAYHAAMVSCAVFVYNSYGIGDQNMDVHIR